MAIRLLIIEDEAALADSIRKGFEEYGYSVRHAANSRDAMYLLEKGGFDIIVLDLMLGGEDGLEICRQLRGAGKNIPVLILSARDRLEDKVRGLEGGADDYLAKPFAFAELLARVRSLLRRCIDMPPPTTTVLSYAGLELDLRHRTGTYMGQTLTLTHKEFSLIEYFLRNPEKIVNRVALAQRVWDKNMALNTNIVDVHINHLRKKLGEGGGPNLIHTVRGAGYIFEKR